MQPFAEPSGQARGPILPTPPSLAPTTRNITIAFNISPTGGMGGARNGGCPAAADPIDFVQFVWPVRMI